MKKKRILIIIIALLAVLFVPWIHVAYTDGGTKEHSALLYKVVEWKRIQDDGDYAQTRVYWGQERFKSLDELWSEESKNVEHSFIATVLEINEDSILVAPVEGEEELYSSDQISFNNKGMSVNAEVGNIVKVTYKGNIKESYPAKVRAIQCEPTRDFRHMIYKDLWMDKQNAERIDGKLTEDFIVTEIYQNCFFAHSVTPTEISYKINGFLSKEWCEGAQIQVTYDYIFFDSQNNKLEGNLRKAVAGTFESESNTVGTTKVTQ